MIILNGEATTFSGETLADLIVEQEFEADVIATAVNGDFVPRTARAQTNLNDGDAVEVFSPRQGG